ncbi:hypothetical protein [Actinacidiphila paucisporea]|uniref:hypothetical protein n=1 Tax=Actinacidiphila paucisporea TaxID=310782 RepID=UPI000936A982|nr:hypothetical protein [Actinacidiphila paucisporea]
MSLPPLGGTSENDNNYADNPFLTSLVGPGYTGAFWSHWREREEIMRQVKDSGMAEPAPPAGHRPPGEA